MAASLEEVRADLASRCPDLFAVQAEDGIHICGGHAVRDLSGREIDRFSVRIVIPAGFPGDLPIVFETGNRLPRSADRHVNPDGSCCVGVPAQLRQTLGKSFKVSGFVLGPMTDYFLGQALVASGGEWPVGEARHGLPGIFDFWRRTLQVSTLQEVKRILAYAAEGRVPRKNVHCPCGSGVRARRCHRRRIKELYSTYSLAFLKSEVENFTPPRLGIKAS